MLKAQNKQERLDRILKKQRSEKKNDTKRVNVEHDVHLNAQQEFLYYMEGVTPLKNSEKVEPMYPKPKPIPVKSIEDEQQVIQDLLSDNYDPAEIQPGEVLSYCREGVQYRVFRKLRRGEYSVSLDELDLHGMTSEEARKELAAFLYDARQSKGECVRIVHGKGRRSSNKGPVLKRKVNHWLSQHDRVLAFHSALPKDGGTGAVYVLLKRL